MLLLSLLLLPLLAEGARVWRDGDPQPQFYKHSPSRQPRRLLRSNVVERAASNVKHVYILADESNALSRSSGRFQQRKAHGFPTHTIEGNKDEPTLSVSGKTPLGYDGERHHQQKLTEDSKTMSEAGDYAKTIERTTMRVKTFSDLDGTTTPLPSTTAAPSSSTASSAASSAASILPAVAAGHQRPAQSQAVQPSMGQQVNGAAQHSAPRQFQQHIQSPPPVPIAPQAQIPLNRPLPPQPPPAMIQQVNLPPMLPSPVGLPMPGLNQAGPLGAPAGGLHGAPPNQQLPQQQGLSAPGLTAQGLNPQGVNQGLGLQQQPQLGPGLGQTGPGQTGLPQGMGLGQPQSQLQATMNGQAPPTPMPQLERYEQVSAQAANTSLEALGCGFDIISGTCKDVFGLGWCGACHDFGNIFLHDCKCVQPGPNFASYTRQLQAAQQAAAQVAHAQAHQQQQMQAAAQQAQQQAAIAQQQQAQLQAAQQQQPQFRLPQMLLF